MFQSEGVLNGADANSCSFVLYKAKARAREKDGVEMGVSFISKPVYLAMVVLVQMVSWVQAHLL